MEHKPSKQINGIGSKTTATSKPIDIWKDIVKILLGSISW